MYKPKVFLSHSKKDIDFIHKLNSELHRCKIETWLDEIDIQHGESWLNSIFEDGISQCDFILIYITENSIFSDMVSKEIDAGMISQLRNKKIKILPYVQNEALRNKLRLDIQSLQAPEFNDNNFYALFPIIVSNIWSHFLNSITAKIVYEKDLEINNLKLKEELKISKSSLMSGLDEEFNFILNKLSRNINFTSIYTLDEPVELISEKYTINLLALFKIIYNYITGEVAEDIIQLKFGYFVKQKIYDNDKINFKGHVNIVFEELIFKIMLQYGFLIRNFNPKLTSSENFYIHKFSDHPYEIFTISEKFDKFNYWLDTHGISVSLEIQKLK